VSQTPVGAKVQVRLKRGSEVLALEITTEELTTVRSEEVNFEKWGLIGQNITDRLAQREKLSNTKGVYVTGVRRGEPAEKGGLDRGDIIVRIGEKDVPNVGDLQKEYDAAVRGKQTMVLLRVRRGLSILPVLLKIDYTEPKEPAPAKPADQPKDDQPKDDKPADPKAGEQAEPGAAK